MYVRRRTFVFSSLVDSFIIIQSLAHVFVFVVHTQSYTHNCFFARFFNVYSIKSGGLALLLPLPGGCFS